jgi:RNA polymerase sigma factor (sigma-70 family)
VSDIRGALEFGFVSKTQITPSAYMGHAVQTFSLANAYNSGMQSVPSPDVAKPSVPRAADPLAPLVARMGKSDEQALAALYDAAIGAIYSLAARIVRDAHLAEEVAEDTFMQAWREATRYDAAKGRVMTWLMVICRSRALDALRRVDPAQAHEDVDSLRGDMAAEANPPDAAIHQFRLGSAVRDALETLPAQERQAVTLSFFRGLTHQEIADLWQMPLGSVKTIMNRAFTQLRSQCATLWSEHNYES